MSCIGCQAGVDVLNKLFSLGVPTSVMKLVGGKLCSLALDESVCTGMIDHFLVSKFKWHLDVLGNDLPDAKACIACIFYFLAGA